MLLESPAFSSFLNALRGTEGQFGASISSSQEHDPVSTVKVSQPEPLKDVNQLRPTSVVQNDQGSAQGMQIIPETFSTFNAVNPAWPDRISPGLYDTQVCTVTSMPEGPALGLSDTGLRYRLGSAGGHEAT